MKSLATLLRSANLDLPVGVPTEAVTKLCTHSKECSAGSIFFAFKGQSRDGSTYALEALAQGALCAIIQEDAPPTVDQRIIRVANPHLAFALMNAAFYDYPQRSLTLIAVSGTDGKSSTAEYLYQILTREGIAAGLFSTTTIDDGTAKIPSPFRVSTPEANLLYPFLRKCAQNGLSHVILEATSHALSREYSRLAGLAFDIGIITTLSGDHLEFHGSKEAYLQTKLSLLSLLKAEGIFISSTENQELERCLAALGPNQKRCILGRDYPYALTEQSDYTVDGVFNGSPFTLKHPLAVFATNALQALLAASAITKKEPGSLLAHLSHLRSPKGRMQRIEHAKGRTIFIDYAHTVGAYEALFSFIKTLNLRGRVITVMGSAGGRDRSKRPLLGKIASDHSDIVIITEEDPVFENLEDITAMITMGITNEACLVLEIPDRKAAIAEAITRSTRGDVILLLGKGHEQSINRGATVIKWDEEEAILEALT